MTHQGLEICTSGTCSFPSWQPHLKIIGDHSGSAMRCFWITGNMRFLHLLVQSFLDRSQRAVPWQQWQGRTCDLLQQFDVTSAQPSFEKLSHVFEIRSRNLSQWVACLTLLQARDGRSVMTACKCRYVKIQTIQGSANQCRSDPKSQGFCGS